MNKPPIAGPGSEMFTLCYNGCMDYIDEAWTPEERAAVKATIERICADLWARKHEHDSLRAGRHWDKIQEWLEDKRPWGGSIGARVADEYAREVERHRALVSYPVEWGFIEGVKFIQAILEGNDGTNPDQNQIDP